MAISKTDIDKYSEFIAGLELKRVYLRSIKSKLNEQAFTEDVSTWNVNAEHKASFTKIRDQEYKVSQKWIIIVSKDNAESALSFDFDFAVVLSSKEPMTKRMFQIYSDNNLNLNTWPYARELINNITARMGIPPLTLPFFKAFAKK